MPDIYEVNVDDWFDFLNDYTGDDDENPRHRHNFERYIAFGRKTGRVWVAGKHSINSQSGIFYVFDNFVPVYRDGVFLGYGCFRDRDKREIKLTQEATIDVTETEPEDGDEVKIVGSPVRWRIL